MAGKRKREIERDIQREERGEKAYLLAPGLVWEPILALRSETGELNSKSGTSSSNTWSDVTNGVFGSSIFLPKDMIGGE